MNTFKFELNEFFDIYDIFLIIWLLAVIVVELFLKEKFLNGLEVWLKGDKEDVVVMSDFDWW